MPKLIFTHYGIIGQLIRERFSMENVRLRNLQELRNKKIIFLARDPRDVVVSYFFQMTKRRHDKYLIENQVSISDFIKHEKFGISMIIDYMNFWYINNDVFSKFLLVKYEDCKENTEKEFYRILNFIGIKKINHSILKKVIDYSSFNSMRKIEEGGNMRDRLKPGDKKDLDSYKVRRGKIGGYKDYFNNDDLAYLNEQMKKLNKDFGYKI